jgi:hypothetical protein
MKRSRSRPLDLPNIVYDAGLRFVDIKSAKNESLVFLSIYPDYTLAENDAASIYLANKAILICPEQYDQLLLCRDLILTCKLKDMARKIDDLIVTVTHGKLIHKEDRIVWKIKYEISN